MTKGLIISVCAGLAAGWFFFSSGIAIPEMISVAMNFLLENSETLLTLGLCLLIFMVGTDLGTQDNIVGGIKAAGPGILLIPVAVAAGTFAGALISSLILPYTAREMMTVGAGFAWYSLAPIAISKFSVGVGAISLLHNVMREIMTILLIPLVAKRVGYIETIALPGAAAMDSMLPLVERAAGARVAVYSFISGLALTIAVPILVPALAAGI